MTDHLALAKAELKSDPGRIPRVKRVELYTQITKVEELRKLNEYMSEISSYMEEWTHGHGVSTR